MRHYADELYHFGIKGMKWGVRRNRSTSSGTGALGGKRQLSAKEREARKRRIKKVATAAALSAAALGVGYLAYKSHKNDKANVAAFTQRMKDLDKKNASELANHVRKVRESSKNEMDQFRGMSRRFDRKLDSFQQGPSIKRLNGVRKSNKKALSSIANKRRSTEKRAFDEFDAAMRDPGSTLVFDKDTYFRRSDGSKTVINNMDQLVGRARRPHIKSARRRR